MRLSTALKLKHIGTNTVIKILQVINEVFDNVLGKLPCRNTIDGWVAKCGLTVFENEEKHSGTAVVMDESMMVGGQKLLVALSVPSEHLGRPIGYGDIQVASIVVKKSINAETISTCVKDASERMSELKYVITDNACTMNKGVKLSGYTHIRDISHSMGMFLERTYKNDEEFKKLSTAVSQSRFKENMKQVGYLLPPTQRTIARFMNLDKWVGWAAWMIDILPRLNELERETYGFVNQHASMIEELQTVVSCIRYIEDKCKHEGLAEKTVNDCIEHIHNTICKGNERMKKLADSIVGFLKEEVKKADGMTINNSTDIIESIFGVYKREKATDKLIGVTTKVLSIPAFLEISRVGAKGWDVSKLVTRNTLRDVKEWRKNNLLENPAQRRAEKMKMVG